MKKETIMDKTESTTEVISQREFECKKLFVDKANNYRLHLDKLRWVLAGVYLTASGAIAQWKYGGESRLALLLAILGIVLDFVLSVQSWHYNLYSEYVKECESRILNEEAKPISHTQFIDQFIRSKKLTIEIGHDSFSFVLLLLWSVIGLNLGWFITSLLPSQLIVLCGRKLFVALSIVVAVLIGILSVRYWNDFVYPKIIRKVHYFRLRAALR